MTIAQTIGTESTTSKIAFNGCSKGNIKDSPFLKEQLEMIYYAQTTTVRQNWKVWMWIETLQFWSQWTKDNETLNPVRDIHTSDIQNRQIISHKFEKQLVSTSSKLVLTLKLILERFKYVCKNITVYANTWNNHKLVTDGNTVIQHYVVATKIAAQTVKTCSIDTGEKSREMRSQR